MENCSVMISFYSDMMMPDSAIKWPMTADLKWCWATGWSMLTKVLKYSGTLWRWWKSDVILPCDIRRERHYWRLSVKARGAENSFSVMWWKVEPGWIPGRKSECRRTSIPEEGPLSVLRGIIFDYLLSLKCGISGISLEGKYSPIWRASTWWWLKSLSSVSRCWTI